MNEESIKHDEILHFVQDDEALGLFPSSVRFTINHLLKRVPRGANSKVLMGVRALNFSTFI